MALANIMLRDCVVMKKGDTITCVADETLLTQGWKGGTFLCFSDALIIDGKAVPRVTVSDGVHVGPMALYGSDEAEDTRTSYSGQYKTYKYVQCTYGNQFFLARNFEVESYFARTSLNSLTDKYGNSHAVLNQTAFSLEYKAGQVLYISERGYFTNEKICSESIQWGIVFSVPSEENSNFLGVSNTF
jgi:hypothetical protein